MKEKGGRGEAEKDKDEEGRGEETQGAQTEELQIAHGAPTLIKE